MAGLKAPFSRGPFRSRLQQDVGDRQVPVGLEDLKSARHFSLERLLGRVVLFLFASFSATGANAASTFLTTIVTR
jgi:hypothetical protein